MSLLSVIVPTHNRARYALPTIEALLSLSDDIEVVVSDTSTDSVLGDQIGRLPGAARVKYVRPPTGISVVDNFNIALGEATGDYLVFIGDDDLVTSHALTLASWARDNDIDSLCFSFPASYYWPDFKHQLRGDFYAGTVRVGPFSGSIRPHDTIAALRAAANQLGIGVLDMPRAYAGMISRPLAQQITAKHGALFGGVSPDIYSAALIASESRSCRFVDYPVVVPGNSGASTAGQSANGGHLGKLRDNAHIGAFKDLVWDDCVPEFYSVPTVWSFSLVKALERLDKLSMANFGRLYVRCLVFHRAYRKETFAAVRALALRRGWFRTAGGLLAGAAAEGWWILRKVISMARVSASGRSEGGLTNVEDTRPASRKIEELLHDHPATATFRSATARSGTSRPTAADSTTAQATP